MAEYLFYKVKMLLPLVGGNVDTRVQYSCEIIPQERATASRREELAERRQPYTDDNPNRLFVQIASLYRSGDKIRTIPYPEITNRFEAQVELKEPLSHDEFGILAVQVLEALGKNKS